MIILIVPRASRTHGVTIRKDFMAQKYRKKEPTGYEYIKASQDFMAAVTRILDKFPDKWKEYTLTPVYTEAEAITNNVVLANAVYIGNNQTPVEVRVKAYEERIGYLVEALRHFKTFDYRFEILVSKIDLLKSERKRLAMTIQGMLAKAGIDAKTPRQEAKERLKSIDPNDERPTVRIEYEINKVNVKFGDVVQSVKLDLTADQIDRLLDLENTAYGLISNRIRDDRNIVKALQKAS